jgi:hypothetical protein
MTMRRLSGGGLWLVVVVLCGCTNARYITVDPTGGVVAIPSNSNAWPTYNRDKAEELMRQKCPQGYVIDREQEVVVGQTHLTNTNTETSGNATLAALHIAPVTQETHETVTSKDQTEWRIWFHAKDAPALAAEPVQQAGGLPVEPAAVQ